MIEDDSDKQTRICLFRISGNGLASWKGRHQSKGVLLWFLSSWATIVLYNSYRVHIFFYKTRTQCTSTHHSCTSIHIDIPEVYQIHCLTFRLMYFMLCFDFPYQTWFLQYAYSMIGMASKDQERRKEKKKKEKKRKEIEWCLQIVCHQC